MQVYPPPVCSRGRRFTFVGYILSREMEDELAGQVRECTTGANAARVAADG